MRSAPTYYIPPTAISITPNANNSANDLVVYIEPNTRIKVFDPRIEELYPVNGAFLEWQLTGRNRRLKESDKPYTIYARIGKADEVGNRQAYPDAYLVFAAQVKVDEETWEDPYDLTPNVSDTLPMETIDPDGEPHKWPPLKDRQCRNGREKYWWVKLGTVSLPVGGLRSVDLDTGILGTDLYNVDWILNPDKLPMRVDIGNSQDAYPPYVAWEESVTITANLIKGWDTDLNGRVHHWSITRDTGNAKSDAAWEAAGRERDDDSSDSDSIYDDSDSSDEEWDDSERRKAFARTGIITLNHTRRGHDDFSAAVAATFHITAWQRDDDSSDSDSIYDSSDDDSIYDDSSSSDEPVYVALATGSITIFAETVERYELAVSPGVVTYNPATGEFTPEDGVTVRIRAVAQDGSVAYMDEEAIATARLRVYAVPVGYEMPYDDSSDEDSSDSDSGDDGIMELAFYGDAAMLPVTFFADGCAHDILVVNGASREVARSTVAFLRDGEDSKMREWIFLRSTEAIAFGSPQHPYPADITVGEVEPTGAAADRTPYDDTLDGWVPKDWWDEQQGTDPENCYEYGAYRDFLYTSDSSDSDSDSSSGDGQATLRGHWGPFSEPKIWTHYGKDGENAVHLDLDNEHEDFLYNDNDVLVAPSGGATSAIHLYDGAREVTSGFTLKVYDDHTETWVDQTGSSASADASISGTTLTVRGIRANAVKVRVRAEYPSSGGKYYFADFTANRTNQDKYDLILTPSSIPYNESNGSSSQTPTIHARATRIDLQGNKSDVTIAIQEGVGNVCLYRGNVDSTGRVNGMSLVTDPNHDFTPWGSDFASSGLYFELRKLLSGTSGNWQYRLCDYETIPIVKAKDGNGISGVTRLYARSSDGGIDDSDDSSDDDTTPPQNIDTTIGDNGWCASSPEVTTDYPYLWVKEQTTFTDTTMNTTKYYCVGKLGDPGIDGGGSEWVYMRTKKNVAPLLADDSYDNDPVYTTRYTDDDYLPLITNQSEQDGCGAESNRCTDDPTGVNSTYRYEWVAKRMKLLNSDNKTRSWQKYYTATAPSRAMALHSRYSEDGETYFLTSTVENITIPSDQTSTAVSGITVRYRKRVGANPETSFRGFWGIYLRVGTTYYYYDVQHGSDSIALEAMTFGITVSSVSGHALQAEAVVVIVTDAMQTEDTSGTHPTVTPPDTYLAKIEIPVIKLADTGQRGKTGPTYYYLGEWMDSTSADYIPDNTTIQSTDYERPFVSYTVNRGTASEKIYYFLYIGASPITTPTTTQPRDREYVSSTTYPRIDSGGATSTDYWEVMTSEFKYIIAEAIFSKFAKLGSAIFNLDWMYSQYGKIWNGEQEYTIDAGHQIYDGKPGYTYFDPSDPMAAQSVHFAPRAAIDWLTGAGHLAGGNIRWDGNGIVNMVGVYANLFRHIPAKLSVNPYEQQMWRLTEHDVYICETPSSGGNAYLILPVDPSNEGREITIIHSNIYDDISAHQSEYLNIITDIGPSGNRDNIGGIAGDYTHTGSGQHTMSWGITLRFGFVKLIAFLPQTSNSVIWYVTSINAWRWVVNAPALPTNPTITDQ